jgi:hypothetical protein
LEADVSRNIHAPIEHRTDDLLGRSKLAGRIYNRLCGNDCPQVIGVYGGWGTGKTSLLNLMNEINQEKRGSGDGIFIKTIDAWAYEQVGSLFEPIIVTLKDLASKEAVSSPTAKKYLRRMTKFILMSASDVVLRKLGLSLDDAKRLMAEATEGDGKSYLDWENMVDDAKGTEDAFRELVKVALDGLKKDGYRLGRIVFFIDNLDRCSPENAIQLLESIRNFLTVPDCIWLLAVDSDVVASYITKKYEDTSVDGYSYLDKVAPEQYHLSLSPTLDREGIADILNSAADGGDASHRIDESKIPQIPKILVPRRLLKAARKFYEYYQDPAEGVSPDTILGLTLLYHTWPDFYQRLSSASKEHIGGLFDHFFDADGSRRARRAIPLSGRFAKDEELIYFIRTTFGDYENLDARETLLREILLALRELKRLGLP